MPIELVSSDGLSFPISWKTMSMFKSVKDVIDDLGFEEHEKVEFPVQVISAILKMAIEWADHHKDDPALTPEEEEKKEKDGKLSAWDKKFLEPIDPGTLFELILAAKTLEAKGLLGLTCKRCHTWIHGKTPDQIRAKFGITNDFTPEEQKLIEMENEWCQESK